MTFLQFLSTVSGIPTKHSVKLQLLRVVGGGGEDMARLKELPWAAGCCHVFTQLEKRDEGRFS